jgi:hypothetical protein
MVLHDGDVHGITRRQPSMPEYNLLRALCDDPIDSQDLIDNPKQSIERWLNGFAAVDGRVPVQDLLQHLGIGNETLALTDQHFE